MLKAGNILSTVQFLVLFGVSRTWKRSHLDVTKGKCRGGLFLIFQFPNGVDLLDLFNQLHCF